MAINVQKFDIKINDVWCKGCEICVAFCPKKVLTMEKSKAKVVNPESCTGCQLCEIYCPDFAIEVEKL
ncbi:MAG: 4Fe-4S binding protein [candidate division WOR-3 bacterium]